MNHFDAQFFAAALTAGSIITGLCGLFLVFRIQREADYFRRCEQQHFTSSMLLVFFATVTSLFFGVWAPLFALVGIRRWWLLNSPADVVGGLVGATVLVLGYIVDEMVHYEILLLKRPARKNKPRLKFQRFVKLFERFVKLDSDDFCRELWVWLGSIILAFILGLLSSLCASRASSTTRVALNPKSHPAAKLTPGATPKFP